MKPEKFTNTEPTKSINVKSATKIDFGYFFIRTGIEHKNDFKISILCKNHIGKDANNEKAYETFTHPILIGTLTDLYSPEKNPKIDINSQWCFPIKTDILEITVSNSTPIKFDVDIEFTIL